MISAFSKENCEIEQGALFRRGCGAMSEIAEVLDVGRDRMGIPHVRYNRHLVRGNYAENSEQRTLSLDSFCARYKERIRYNAETNCVESAQVPR
jgi:hypothetical protein